MHLQVRRTIVRQGPGSARDISITEMQSRGAFGEEQVGEPSFWGLGLRSVGWLRGSLKIMTSAFLPIIKIGALALPYVVVSTNKRLDFWIVASGLLDHSEFDCLKGFGNRSSASHSPI
jgi:hypothetical protein